MNKLQGYLRSIPELLPKATFYKGVHEATKEYLSTFLFVYFGIMILVLCGVLLLSYFFYSGVKGAYQAEEVQLRYWEEVATLYPNYPDAYYNAAYYAARVGEKHRALQYVESALYLDGDFSEAKNLRDEILEM